MALEMRDLPSAELPEWLIKAPLFNKDPVGAARALRPVIEEGAAEGERLGYIPDKVVRAIADAGLFGLFVPREMGGIEADPDTYISTIEELSYADGSTGWVLMATTFGISGAALWLGASAIESMFEKREGFICAGQIAPLGKAERVSGGYRVSGVFQFGSGARLASWLFGAFVLTKDGKPDLSPEGKPQLIWAFGPRHHIRLREDSWDVMGLKATASYDYEFVEQFVPDDFVMFPFTRKRRGGPVYELGVAMAHVSWALGVGMRVLDEIKDLAARKRRVGRATLIDQPTFQRDFAQAFASMQAARAYVRNTFNAWFEAAKHGKPNQEMRAQGRLAACWATEVAANVGRFAYLAAGSDGLRNHGGDNRLQRCFRDLHAGTQHKIIEDNIQIECGTVLLGISDPNLVL
jgi:alkylation response protein AidB-like acyl-CoA dehydrogenase